MSKGAYWSLRVPMGVGVWPLVCECALRCLSLPTGD